MSDRQDGVGPRGSLEDLKADAARAALSEVRSGMCLGLGTGSTMRHFIDALGAALREGALRDLRGVPTSLATEAQARALGIPLTTLDEDPVLDLAVDGADEVDPSLDLIKGLGGALVREKMVVQAARRFVVLADETKVVDRLGERAPLPVEVIPFGWGAHVPVLHALGAERVVLRVTHDGEGAGTPVRTDNGNFILDAHFPGGMRDPVELEQALRGRAGILDSGLFLGMAHTCYLAGSGGVERRERPSPGTAGN
jgi:ribose 5-phosphate isomerase A